MTNLKYFEGEKMKKGFCFLMTIICIFLFVGCGSTKGVCKYSGHWTSRANVPELYIEDDGSAYAIMYASKAPSSADSFDTYIHSLVKGYVEDDKIVFTERAEIYDPYKLRVVEDGVPKEEEYYFHNVSDVTDDKWEAIAIIATINPATDEAIKVIDFYPRALDYIK